MLEDKIFEIDKAPEDQGGEIDVTIWKYGIRIDFYGYENYCELSYEQLKLVMKRVENLRSMREEGQKKLELNEE